MFLLVYFTRSLLFAQALLAAGPGAVLETSGFSEQAAIFSPGTQLFVDRHFGVNDRCPKRLLGLKLLRGSIDHIDVVCKRAGLVTILTPEPEPSVSDTSSRQAELLEAGFTQRADVRAFSLFRDGHPYDRPKPYDIVLAFQKRLKTGERLKLGKWAVLVGFHEAKFKPPAEPSWESAEGEVLYNGVRLPKEWPPRHIHPLDERPMPVPYLDTLPEVVPIDLGRQLFVDDFLIDRSSLKRTFHKPVKYAGNPVLKAETPLEKTPKTGLAMACPKSGGLWWDAKEQLFRLFMPSTAPLLSQSTGRLNSRSNWGWSAAGNGEGGLPASSRNTAVTSSMP